MIDVSSIASHSGHAMPASITSLFLSLAVIFLFQIPAAVQAKERSGRVTFSIAVSAPQDAKTVKLWFPYPTSDPNQKIEDLRFGGNYSTFTLSREPESGALYLYTQWNGPFRERTMKVSFLARARELRVTKLTDQGGAIPPDVRKYIEAEFWIPSDNEKIRKLARQITAGKKGILAKARAIYDWTVDNTRRDPDVPGCGLGNVEATLASRSGKCADISSVYVALARAAGVPAREVFGLRLGQPGQSDITDGHHCWAEFYLPGTGWVPVDPADVRKVMLVKNLPLSAAGSYREYYFGGVDQYRIVLQRGGRGLNFPEGNAQRVNYFMYPNAEVDGRALDYCKPKSFSFTISFQES